MTLARNSPNIEAGRTVFVLPAPLTVMVMPSDSPKRLIEDIIEQRLDDLITGLPSLAEFASDMAVYLIRYAFVSRQASDLNQVKIAKKDVVKSTTAFLRETEKLVLSGMQELDKEVATKVVRLIVAIVGLSTRRWW